MIPSFMVGGITTGPAPTAVPGVPAPTLTGSPTLLASWDFDNASTLTLSGSDITSISGADSTSYTLTSGASKPTLVARGGRNTARFTSASSQYMQVASALGWTGAITIVVVCEPATAAASQAVADLCNGASISSLNRWTLFGNTSGPSWTFRKAGAGANQSAVGANSSFSAAKRLLVGHGASGDAACYINIDGSSAETASAGTVTDPTGVNLFTLGARSASSGTLDIYLDAYVWRVLVYGASFDATQREEVAQWSAVVTNYNTTNAA